VHKFKINALRALIQINALKRTEVMSFVLYLKLPWSKECNSTVLSLQKGRKSTIRRKNLKAEKIFKTKINQIFVNYINFP